MQCPVCLERTQLRVTNCGNKHSFCLRCLQSLRLKHGRRFSCPLCRQSIALTSRDASSFPLLRRTLLPPLVQAGKRSIRPMTMSEAAASRREIMSDAASSSSTTFQRNLFWLMPDGTIRRGLVPVDGLSASRPPSSSSVAQSASTSIIQSSSSVIPPPPPPPPPSSITQSSSSIVQPPSSSSSTNPSYSMAQSSSMMAQPTSITQSSSSSSQAQASTLNTQSSFSSSFARRAPRRATRRHSKHPLQRVAPASDARAAHPWYPLYSLTLEQRLRHPIPTRGDQDSGSDHRPLRLPSIDSSRDQDRSLTIPKSDIPAVVPFRSANPPQPETGNIQEPSGRVAGAAGVKSRPHFPIIRSSVVAGSGSASSRRAAAAAELNQRTNTFPTSRRGRARAHAPRARLSRRFNNNAEQDETSTASFVDSSDQATEMDERSTVLISSILNHIRDPETLDNISQQVRERAKQVEKEDVSRAARLHEFEERFKFRARLSRGRRQLNGNDVRGVVAGKAVFQWLPEGVQLKSTASESKGPEKMSRAKRSHRGM